MQTPYFIKNDDELKRLHLQGKATGNGFIYNDYSGNIPSGALGNVLHRADCRNISKSNTKYPKVFFDRLDEAAQWITRERGAEGERWRRCECCRSERVNSGKVQLNTTPPKSTRKATALSEPRHEPTRHHDHPSFTEDKVEDFLLPWLEAQGYSVQKRVRTSNGIIDMVARNSEIEWIIEAKGEDKGGFGTAEMNFRIGVTQICSRKVDRPNCRLALAIPMTPTSSACC